MSEVDELSLENTKQESSASYNWSNRVKSGYGQWYAKEADRDYFAAWLVPLSKALPINLHTFKIKNGDGDEVLITVPCKKSKVLTNEPDKVKCEGCTMPDAFNPKKKCKATASLVIPGYFFESVGNVIEVPGENGEKIKINDNPTKFAILKRGKDDVNLSQMKEYDNEGELMNEIWALRRYPKELKKALQPAVAVRKKVDKQFQHIGGANVPTDVLEKFDNMTKEEVRGLAINLFAQDPYGSIDWENQHMLKFVVKPKEAQTSDAAGETPDMEKEFDG